MFWGNNPDLPSLLFLGKAKKTTQKSKEFSLCRTPKIPGKEGKKFSLKKARKLQGKGKKQGNPKSKERKIRELWVLRHLKTCTPMKGTPWGIFRFLVMVLLFGSPVQRMPAPPRPAAALRARECPRKRGCARECPKGVPGPFWARGSESKKVSQECPHIVPDTFLTFSGHFWTLRSSGPKKARGHLVGHSLAHPHLRGHPQGHSRGTSGPKGSRLLWQVGGLQPFAEACTVLSSPK